MSRQGLFQRSQHSQALFAQRREIAPGGPEGHGASRRAETAGDLLTDKEDIQDAQDHRVDWVDSVIKRNHCNQYVPMRCAPSRCASLLKTALSSWVV